MNYFYLVIEFEIYHGQNTSKHYPFDQAAQAVIVRLDLSRVKFSQHIEQWKNN